MKQLKKNKKGNIDAFIDMLSAPIMVVFLIIIAGAFIYMGSSFNTKIQGMDVPTEAKTISTDISGTNETILFYVPGLFILFIFILTLAFMFFSRGDDILFIFSAFIYILYTAAMGAFKVMFLNVAQTNLINTIVNDFFFVNTYFEFYFIFHAFWFFILLIIWGTR